VVANRAAIASAHLFNLGAHLLFFDTTSTYFERDDEDGDITDADS
jgi:hypothetical protein